MIENQKKKLQLEKEVRLQNKMISLFISSSLLVFWVKTIWIGQQPRQMYELLF